MRQAGLMATMLIMLSACLPESPPSQFFRLEPFSAEERRPRAIERPLAVNSVVLPPELERSELIRYGAAGQVELLSTDRWAAPLEDLVFRTLALNLSARLDRVVLPGQPKPREGSRSLDVVIEEFGAVAGEGLSLEAHWTISGAGGEPLIERSSHISRPMSSRGADAITTAMSEALGVLSSEIAEVVADLEA